MLKELPQKIRQIIVLPRNNYGNQIQKEFETLAEAVSETSSAQVSFEQMSGVRHDTALAKVKDVVEHVSGIDHQVVVMAHHKDVVEGIKVGLDKAGKRVVTLTGDAARLIDRTQSKLSRQATPTCSSAPSALRGLASPLLLQAMSFSQSLTGSQATCPKPRIVVTGLVKIAQCWFSTS